MTISASGPSYVQLPGNGVAMNFAFPFKIFAATDLIVGFITSSGYTEQTSGFTVQNVDINGGGNLVFSTPPPAGTTVDIRTDTPQTQNTEFANLGAFLPETHTEAFDRITRVAQDIFRRTYTFGIHGPDTEDTPWTALPPAAIRAGSVLAFDVNGLPTLGVPVAGTITQQIIGTLLYPQTAAELAAGVTPTNYAYPQGYVQRYGADPTGTNDSTSAFTQALSVGGKVLAIGTFLISSGLTMNVSTTMIQGPCLLNCTQTTGSVLTMNAGSTDLNHIYGLDRVFFNGQGANTAVIALNIDSTSGTVNNFGIQNCIFKAFGTGVQITSNAWEVEFLNCSWSSCGGVTAALNILYEGSERNSVVQGAFYNCTNCINQASGGELYLTNVSLDYAIDTICVCASGVVSFSQCYFESYFDNAYWFQTNPGNTDPAALIDLNECFIACVGAKVTYNIGYSNSGYGGGIRWKGGRLYVGGSNELPSPIIHCSSIAAMAQVSGIAVDGYENGGYLPGGASEFANVISNGGLGAGFTNGLNGWTYGSNTGSGGNPTVSSAALILHVTEDGQDQFAYWSVPAQPGQNIGAMCTALGEEAACGFELYIQAVGADGTVLGSAPLVSGRNEFIGNLPTAATVCIAGYPNLPAGTSVARIGVNTGGAANTSQSVQVTAISASTY